MARTKVTANIQLEDDRETDFVLACALGHSPRNAAATAGFGSAAAGVRLLRRERVRAALFAMGENCRRALKGRGDDGGEDAPA